MSYKVLFIDDDYESMLEPLLEDLNRRSQDDDAGIEFVGLQNRSNLLTLITAEQPDAIFLDYVFDDFRHKDTSGDILLREIRRYYPYMPVVMMTGVRDLLDVDTERQIRWLADDLLFKTDFIGQGFRCSDSGWELLINTCLAAIRYHGTPDDFSNDPRLHADCVAHLKTAAQSNSQPDLFFLQGDLGSGRRLFALAMQNRLGLEHPNALTEINCAPDCLDKKPDFLKLFSPAKGRVLFLRDVDQIPEESEADFIKAIEEWRKDKKNWVAAASSGPISTLFGQDIETVFGQNVRTVSFPSLKERLGTGGQPFFKRLCEEIATCRQKFKKESSESHREVSVTQSDILWLLALHEWSGNIRELEEVLNIAVYESGMSVIQTRDIIRCRYTNPEVCIDAANIVSESDETIRARLMREYPIKDPIFIWELLIRCYVMLIHDEERTGDITMGHVLEHLGLDEDTVASDIIKSIEYQIDNARKELAPGSDQV